MKFFLYSATNAGTIASKLGAVDYSYYFVLECFRPLLELLGEVEILEQPLSEQTLASVSLTGQDYYFSFTPPNRVELTASIPCVPVFAWEFGTLPDDPVTAPCDDWNHVLQVAGQAITHSSFAVDVVKKSLGDSYPVVSIPAPIWDKFAPLRSMRAEGKLPLEKLALQCVAIDSNDFLGSDDGPVRESAVQGLAHDSRDLVQDNSNAWSGVHPLEDWGRWSAQDECSVSLLYPVSGNVLVSFVIINSLLQPGHLIQVTLGTYTHELLVKGGQQQVELLFPNMQQAERLSLTGLGPGVSTGAEDDARVMGIGISRLYVRAPRGVLTASDSIGQGNLLRQSAVHCLGFHQPEAWGRWSAERRCQIFLPFYIEGNVELTFTISANPHKQRAPLVVTIGDQSHKLAITGLGRSHKVSFSGIERNNLISIEGIEPARVEDGEDPREIGLGFSAVELHLDSRRQAAASDPRALIGRSIVYTTVFNPIDGRKNWPDIINAFVFAFREQPEALLLVKLTHRELSPFVQDLCSYFTSHAPFKCRIIFLHGYLSDDEYNRLIRASDYVVNASRGEGQCLPLMEFMSSGVPAIAPDSSAMADYVNSDNAFIVSSSVEPAVWPHDPRMLFRTTRYRISWESLYLSFGDSFQLAASDAVRYGEMSDAAIEAQRQYCSIAVLKDRLEQFLAALKVEELS